MSEEPVPAWLAAWREGRTALAQPPHQRESAPRQGCTRGKRQALAVAAAQRPNYHGFIEPERWPYDGGKRREAVYDADHNPPRLVRRVGWRKCMTCGSPFFSEDVIALRLCDVGPFGGCRDRRPRAINQPKPLRTQEKGRPA